MKWVSDHQLPVEIGLAELFTLRKGFVEYGAGVERAAAIVEQDDKSFVQPVCAYDFSSTKNVHSLCSLRPLAIVCQRACVRDCFYFTQRAVLGDSRRVNLAISEAAFRSGVSRWPAHALIDSKVAMQQKQEQI